MHTLDHFAEAAHLSEFFISAVIVAIVGNAAEHGGAVVIARRGKMRLATEIAVSSSAQVAMLVVPAVCLLSFVVKPALPLTFRPIELIAMGALRTLRRRRAPRRLVAPMGGRDAHRRLRCAGRRVRASPAIGDAGTLVRTKL